MESPSLDDCLSFVSVMSRSWATAIASKAAPNAPESLFWSSFVSEQDLTLFFFDLQITAKLKLKQPLIVSCYKLLNVKVNRLKIKLLNLIKKVYMETFLETGEDADSDERFQMISLRSWPVPSNLRSSWITNLPHFFSVTHVVEFSWRTENIWAKNLYVLLNGSKNVKDP